MLLYNHKQEFIGIDDEGLRLLNYASLEDLLSVCSDVADLFANEPGYIHNFKNFGWIDFLLHADTDASSAIVHGNGRTFSCRLSVTPFHLCDQPAQNGYSIQMSQIKNISGEEFKQNIVTPSTTPIKEFSPPAEPIIETIQSVSLPDYTHLTATQLSEPTLLDIPKTHPTSLDETDDIYASLMAPLSAEELNPTAEETVEEIMPPEVEPIAAPPVTAQRPMLGSTQYSTEEQNYLSHHKIDDAYTYDPNIAANELGLPVDLIEEFIGDFIQQSHDFKNNLFEAAAKNDINNLHILSHKLKGVAANLRIENAFETLSIINSSSEPVEIDANLKYYYNIIAKLEGKEPIKTQEAPFLKEEVTEKAKAAPVVTEEPAEDIYEFALKQNDHEPLLVHLDEIDLETDDSPDIQEEVPFKKEFLELHDTFPEEEGSDTAASIDEPTPEEIPSVSLHYDVKAVAGALGIEPDFMQELLNDYKIDALAMSTTILEAIKAFDTHTWRSSAAKLKGISDNLRLSDISDELAILSVTNDAQEAKKASTRLVNYLDQL